MNFLTIFDKPEEYLTSWELKKIIVNPTQIVADLDKHIIGQTAAKKALSLMYFRRCLIGLQKSGKLPIYPKFDKSNVLLIGDTGCGKTALIRALQKVVNTPIGIADVTPITAAGYIGGKVEDILINYEVICKKWVTDHFENLLTDYDMESMSVPEYEEKKYKELLQETLENGIIYLDEIDKLKCSQTFSKDVNGDMVQNELLKFLENGIVTYVKAKSADQNPDSKTEVPSRKLDTTNLTFICGGTFQGLRDIITTRLKSKTNMGFTGSIIVTDPDEILNALSTEDLIEYGFKPEFLGRLPLRTSLTAMTLDMMERIITEPENNLYDQYRLVFNLFDIDFSIDKEAMRYLAEQALELKMGARSLKQIFTKLLEDALFNIYELDSNFKIGLEYVKERFQ